MVGEMRDQLSGPLGLFLMLLSWVFLQWHFVFGASYGLCMVFFHLCPFTSTILCVIIETN